MASARPEGQRPEGGPDLDEILAAYLEEVEAGRAPDRRAWVVLHPGHEAELTAFFANLDHVGRLADPLRTAPQGCGPDLVPFPAPAGEGARVGYFGDYELLHELGRGGMGVVYAARQVSLDRVLALKLLTPRPGSEADVRRFLREAIAAAGLDHPNLVPIYEVGEHEGRRYYGMKLIDGGSLAQHAPRLKDDPRAAASLVAQVARAIHYAHERGVLHRDLKPANVLLDRRGCPYVADFGLARRVDGEAGLTGSGSVVGTPAYMAPEQAEGRREAVTTAADVYGLGAILYELLTGRPPFPGDSVLEVLALVRDAEPEPPSRFNPRAPRDLQTIAMKCLEKDPRGRYPSAAALADDLGRWLDGVPIAARPATPGERLVKWVHRRPTAAALLVACVVAAAAGGMAAWGAVRSGRLLESARQSDRRLRLAEVEVARQDREREEAEPRGYADRIAAAYRAWEANDVGEADRRLDACPDRLRGWEWSYLKRVGHAERLTIRGHNGVACGVAFAPEPSRFTCPDEHGGLTVWEAGTLRRVAHLRGHDGTSYGVAFDPAGARLATAGSDGFVRVWDVKAGRLLFDFRAHGEWAAAVAFSPDGKRLASAGQDGAVRVRDAAGGGEILALTGHRGPVLGVAFCPDGKRLASAGQDGSVILWDARTGAEVRRLDGHADAARCVAFRPDGERLASGGADREVKVWDAETGRELLRFRAAAARVDGLAYAPDGRTIATGGLDRSVKLWDAATGRELASYRGHAAPVFSVAFSPDGRLLASAGQDGTVKLWDATAAPDSRRLRPGRDGVRRPVGLSFSSDGSLLAATGGARGVDVFDLAAGRAGGIAHDGGASASALAFRPGGRLLAMTDDHGAVRLADATSGETRRTLGGGDEAVGCLAFSRDGSLLATGGGPGVSVVQLLHGKGTPPPAGSHSVRLWDPSTGDLRHTLRGHTGSVYAVAVRPDGAQVASAGADGTVRLWDATTGDAVEVVKDQDGPAFAVAYRPDGRALASAGDDGKVRVRDLDSAGRVELSGHDGWVLALAYTPDGTRLASAGADGTVRVWDPALGRGLLTLRGPGRRVTSVAFGPHGRTLAAASEDGAVSVWETADGRAP